MFEHDAELLVVRTQRRFFLLLPGNICEREHDVPEYALAHHGHEIHREPYLRTIGPRLRDEHIVHRLPGTDCLRKRSRSCTVGGDNGELPFAGEDMHVLPDEHMEVAFHDAFNRPVYVEQGAVWVEYGDTATRDLADVVEIQRVYRRFRLISRA